MFWSKKKTYYNQKLSFFPLKNWTGDATNYQNETKIPPKILWGHGCHCLSGATPMEKKNKGYQDTYSVWFERKGKIIK